MECNRPEDGTVYNIIKKYKSTYHYMLRSLKNKQHCEIKVSVSKRILKTRTTDYWKTVRNIRRRNFNSSLIVDGVIGNVNMLCIFQDTFYNNNNNNNIFKVQYPMYINIRVQWTVHKMAV